MNSTVDPRFTYMTNYMEKEIRINITKVFHKIFSKNCFPILSLEVINF